MQQFGREPLDSQSARIPRGRLYLIPERCKGCHLCTQFCPCGVLQISTTANGRGYLLPELVPGKESACVHCQFCALICPEFAIFSEEIVQ